MSKLPTTKINKIISKLNNFYKCMENIHVRPFFTEIHWKLKFVSEFRKQCITMIQLEPGMYILGLTIVKLI